MSADRASPPRASGRAIVHPMARPGPKGIEPGTKTTQVAIRIPASQIAAIERATKRRGVKRATLIRAALALGLDELEHREAAAS